jgi:hypothetical protein
MTPKLTQLSYSPFEKIAVPRPVHRLAYVAASSAGRRVLDLGAYDETEISKQHHSSWRWLHAEIAARASAVLGVDSSEAVRTKGSIVTGIGTQITYGDVHDLSTIVQEFRPDLVVAGELIEHTENTVGWLRALGDLLPSTEVILTTPNATSIINLFLAPLNRENCHEDHLHIYSFKTLTTLARRLHLDDLRITPYYYDSHILKGRFAGVVAPIIDLIDFGCLRPTQFLFPLTAFGWILQGRFSKARPK